MSQDWQNSYFFILFGAAMLHGLYLSLHIFLKARTYRANAWLGLALLGVASLLINYFIFISGAVVRYPHLLNVFVPLSYLIAPSIYFFIRKTSSNYQLKVWHLLHLLPLLWALWESLAVFQWSAADKLTVINGLLGGRTPTPLELILGNRFNFIMAAYGIAALIHLNGVIKSAIRPLKHLLWLRKFTSVFLSLVLAAIVLPLVMILLSMNGAWFELIITLAYSLAIYVLAFNVSRNQNALPWAVGPSKYQNSPLKDQGFEEYKSRLLHYLEEEEPWLNPKFSISDLSGALDIPKHHLSQVLNEGMQMSFVDLVNAYRVESAKKMLRSGALEKYSMMGIASECGFASKSTFNRAFKKCTGLTPSAFLTQDEMPASTATRVG